MSQLVVAAKRQGTRWWAGQLAGWLLTALVVTYATWFFGFADVHEAPLSSKPTRILVSDRPFSDLREMLGPLQDATPQVAGKTGLGRPTIWMQADIPKGLRGHGRTIHLPEKSIARGEVALLNSKGDAVMWAMFGVGLTPLEARRAVPGYAFDVPHDWNEIDDLKLVARVEPLSVTNALGVDLWYTQRFQDAQFKLQQRTAILIGALMLLTLYALAAAQAGRVPYLLVFAFWLVARCAFVINAGGFGFFSFGVAAGSPLGLGLRQLAMASFPFATALLASSLMQSELHGTFARKLLKAAVVIGGCATVVAGLLPPTAFLLVLWTTASVVILTIFIVIPRAFSLTSNATTRWYLAALLVDLAAGINEMVMSMGAASPLPEFTLQQVSLISAMLTGIAVGSMVAKERAKRLQAQEAAIEVLGRYEAVYRTVPIGLISFGPGDQVERFNDGFARMFGMSSGPIDMKALNQVFPIALRKRIRAELLATGECDFPHHIGDEASGRWLRVMARGSEESFEASITDITEHKNVERRLAYAAEHDALTGALNRRGLGRRIARLLEAGADVDRLSLVYLDLDRFKLLNDLFGHQSGDLVLQEVVSRMQRALGDGIAVARLGGDEFAALLDAADSERHEELARRVLQVIAGEPFQIPSRSFTVTASVGMFRFATGLSQEALIAGADRACLDAKRKGRNQVVVQNDASALIMRQMAELSVLADLGDSNTFGDFELTIQPIVSLQDPRRLGGEVLLRQRAPDGILQSADHLIEAAEERGELANVERWILRQTLLWLSRHGERFGLLDFLSLNLSGCSLNDEFFKTFVLALLRKHHHVAHLLVIEITEVVAMQDVFVLEKFVAQLRETGARLALDDFGSGYSSFASLNDVGASYLKIDGKFVKAMAAQSSSTTVIRTINVLAHELGMECIADSVDDAQTLALLTKLGADYVQGAALFEPQSLADFEALCGAGTIDHPPEIRRALGAGPEFSARRQLALPTPVA